MNLRASINWFLIERVFSRESVTWDMSEVVWSETSRETKGRLKARQMEGRGMSSACEGAHTGLTPGIMIIRNQCYILRANSLR